MFRIHFDPQVSKFVVQMLVWGFMWVTCKEHHENRDGPGHAEIPVRFNTFKEAEKWVSDKGLPEAYQRQENVKALYAHPYAR